MFLPDFPIATGISHERDVKAIWRQIGRVVIIRRDTPSASWLAWTAQNAGTAHGAALATAHAGYHCLDVFGPASAGRRLAESDEHCSGMKYHFASFHSTTGQGCARRARSRQVFGKPTEGAHVR